MHIEQEIWRYRLIKSQFSQLVGACGRFQGIFFIISDLQICEKLYDVGFMLCLIFTSMSFFPRYNIW